MSHCNKHENKNLDHCKSQTNVFDSQSYTTQNLYRTLYNSCCPIARNQGLTGPTGSTGSTQDTQWYFTTFIT